MFQQDKEESRRISSQPEAVVGPWQRAQAQAMKLVLIEWVDSMGCASQWTPIGGVTPQPSLCKSVGWLIHDSPDCKVLVPHLSEPDSNGE
jgi:hypothetical protein